jgi:hypothetical protein
LHLAREAPWYMMRLAGQAQHRRSRLNSNVRPHTKTSADALPSNQAPLGPDPKSMKHYTIAGGDDGCYGPRFGPALAEEAGVFGTEANACLVLRLLEPINEPSIGTVRLLAVRPRYVGVAFEEINKSGGTVGISLVLPGHEASITLGLSDCNSKYWAIGTCTPSEA